MKKLAEGSVSSDLFDATDSTNMIPQDDAHYKARVARDAAEFGATVDWCSDVSSKRQMPFWYIGKEKICDIHLDGWLVRVFTPNDCTIEMVGGDDITSPDEAYAAGLFVDSDVDGSSEFDWGVNDGFVYACYPPTSDGSDYYLPGDYGWDNPSTLDSIFDFTNLEDIMADMESEYESDNPPDIEEDDLEGLPDDGDISESKSKRRRGKRAAATLIKDAGNVEANVAHFNKMMGSAPCPSSACGDSMASCIESVAAGDDSFDVANNTSERLSAIGDYINDNTQSKTPEEIDSMTFDVMDDMLSEYGMRIRNVLSILSSHRELLRTDYASSGLVHDSVINGMICREYKKLGIALDDGYGHSTFPKNVLQVDADRHGGSVRLVIRHYWCAAKMYADEDQFYFDAGHSGATSPSRDLVKTKYLFLKQFVDTFDILERVVVEAVSEDDSSVNESTSTQNKGSLKDFRHQVSSDAACSEAVGDNHSKSLRTATPYMLRNDGKLIECAPMHPYIMPAHEGADILKLLKDGNDEKVGALRWFREHTGNGKLRETIDVVLGYFGIEKTGAYEASDEEILDFVRQANNLSNQEFLRLRTSSMLYGGTDKSLYARISSVDFNWYPLLSDLLLSHPGIENITICKDSNTFGGRFEAYSINGVKCDRLPVDEFLCMRGSPIVEGIRSKYDIVNNAIKLLSDGKAINEAYPNMHPRYLNGWYKTEISERLEGNLKNSQHPTGAVVDEAPEKHRTLNAKLWNIEDNTLKTEVKEKVDAIVKDFCDGLDDNEVKYKLADVRLVGSNCSYNYTDKSDLDVHIVFDLGIYDDTEKEQMAETIYNYARSLWGKTHSVEFYGIPVEVFVETNNTVDLNAADKS